MIDDKLRVGKKLPTCNSTPLSIPESNDSFNRQVKRIMFLYDWNYGKAVWELIFGVCKK